jgi:hypothetical protein
MNDQNDDRPMDQLLNANRIRGESRLIREGTAAEAITQELATAVGQAVNKYRVESGHSLNGIARAIGWSVTPLSTFLKGRYAGDWQALAIDLDTWLEDQKKHDAMPRPATFVWTQVAREILTIADAAIHLRKIGLVYGPDSSGIGKTMTLQAIHQEKPGSVMVTAEKAKSSPSAFFRSIAEQMDIPKVWQLGDIFDEVVRQFKGTPRLLLIDQVHSLCDSPDDRVFFMLMDLYDATNSPQLWCGTADIVAYFTRRITKGRETLAQIRRRIRPIRDLMARTRGAGGGGTGGGEPLYSVQEVREVFARNKIRLSSDAIRYLMRLANLPDCGGLGTCVDLVQMATLVGIQNGAELLTAEHLRGAMVFLIQPEGVQLLDARMDEEDVRPVAKLA